VLGTSFHPELTGDDRVHVYFLRMLDSQRPGAAPELVAWD
jgi:glutamine amidotransferase PdxT